MTDPLAPDPDPSTPIEPDAAQVAALNQAVMAYVAKFLDTRAGAPVIRGEATPALLADLRQPPREQGRPIDALLDALDRALDTGFDTASGRMLSYIPSGGLHASALGAFLGAVTNRFTGAAHAGAGPVALEQGVIDWMTGLFDLPDSSGGVLLSGGSIANLTAMVAARTRLGEDFDDGVVYTSAWAHHSIDKAARIAGIATRRVRKLPTDADLRLDVGALRQAMVDDRAAGLRPLMIAATAGLTDTGAIDPLAACADLAREHAAWFHVDAAYGGFFQLTERGRARLHGIDRADSITVDGHKSLLLPFGIGGLLVRDRRTLVQAHEGSGHYMQDVAEGEQPHFFQLGPELTRPFRGLSAWLPLHLHGVAPFRDTLDRMLDFAEWAAAEILAMPTLELLHAPALSVVVFRSTRGDAATAALHAAVNASGQAHLSTTTVDGRIAIRIAFLSQRTTAAIVRRLLDVLRDAANIPA